MEKSPAAVRQPACAVDAPKVHFQVFGCQMNVVDAELVLGRFEALGYRETASPDEADVIVFNTCSVRGHAEDRVYSRLGALRPWKRRRPGRVLAVMGCMAQREAREMRRRMPHVDVVAGTRDFPALPRLVERVRRGEGPFVVVDGEARPDVERRPASRPRPHQAFVAVMRGCNRPCTYCIVPKVRGREVSRPVSEVVDEVKRLVDDGVVEVCLLGQTVNAYDGGERGRVTLGTLLRALDRIEGLRRLRFVTSHPSEFNEDTLDAMAESPILDRFLHMPVQSGSDRVLRAMKRGYTVDRYRRTVDRIRERIPDMEIGCDWIVGFPGETEEDHARSVALCREIEFSQSFVFKYSPRPGTEAARLPDDVPLEVKKRRNRELLAAQEEVSERRNRALVGEVLDVLFDGPSRTDPAKIAGRDRAHRIVVVDGREAEPGAFARVEVTGATALTLFGRVVARA